METKTNIMALFGVALMSGGLVFAMSGSDNFDTDVSPQKETGNMIRGHVTATLYDEDGNIKAYREGNNRIVAGGLETIVLQTFGNWTNTVGNDGNSFNHTGATNHGGAVKFMAIGTGGDTTTALDFDIEGKVFGGTCNNQTAQFQMADGGSLANPNTNSILYIYTNVTFTGASGCDGAVDEAALYTSMGGGIGGAGAKAGHMFARQSFTEVTVQSTDTLKINWDISFADT